MSSIYIQEPPTHGKVSLETSVGDIEIELWSRECPKACRNFVQLCMEGYYNKNKFHRVVKDFIVQGGDPTGSGQGGESIYGAPFKDECHSRLRFVRRGLVAMANAGKDDNASQFFFTMGPTQELQGKHTLFGKVVGDTIYNMVKLQEVEVGPDDRPLHPPKILKTKVLNNPFPDIEPRKAIEMILDDDENQKKKKKPKSNMKATKNFKLMSFGEEAEEEEEALQTVSKSQFKKPKSAHDLLNDEKLSKDTGAIIDSVDTIDGDIGEKISEKDDQVNIESLRDKLKSKKPKKAEKRVHEEDEIILGLDDEDDMFEDEGTKQKRRKEEIRKEIRALKKDLKKGDTEPEAKVDKDQVKTKLQKLTEEERNNDMLVSFHAEQEKYEHLKASKKGKSKNKGSKREALTMDFLKNFKSKLFTVKNNEENETTKKVTQDIPPKKLAEDIGTNKIDAESSEDDDNWMANSLKFQSDDPVLAKDASTKDDDWFDIYDPRNPMNKRRRERDSNQKTTKKWSKGAVNS